MQPGGWLSSLRGALSAMRTHVVAVAGAWPCDPSGVSEDEVLKELERAVDLLKEGTEAHEAGQSKLALALLDRALATVSPYTQTGQVVAQI